MDGFMPDDRTPQERREEVERLMPDPDRRDDALERLWAISEHVEGLWPERYEMLSGTADDLTPTQARVVECLSRGLGNRGAAELLGFTIPAVQSHVKRAMNRLGAKNATHLVAECLRRGLIS